MKNFFKNLLKNIRTYPDRVNEDPAKTKIVYAGPPKGMGRKNRMVCVYAGPSMMGQLNRRRDSEMEDVYAGPPMPEDPDEPEIIEPEITELEITEPEITEPEITEPEITEPEITEPEITEPEITEPEITEESDNVGKLDKTEESFDADANSETAGNNDSGDPGNGKRV